MLKLKGQTEAGKWVEFNISQVFDVCLRDNRWYVKGCPNDCVIDTTTIQLADDPRKAMLDEIREWLNADIFSRNSKSAIQLALELQFFLDEMEAKL